MARRGGEAGKVGDRYESMWTVHCMLDVLEGKADSIRLEPPGCDWAEFALSVGSTLEYHQTKRTAGTGRWTLNHLCGEGVLQYLPRVMANPGAAFVFVSGSEASELQSLADRALGSESLEEFLRQSLSDELRGAFDALCHHCGTWSREDAFRALKRIRVEHLPEDHLRRWVCFRASVIIDDDGTSAVSALRGLLDEAVDGCKTLTANSIWAYLRESHGLRPSRWDMDRDKVAQMAGVTDRYVRQLRGLSIAGRVIVREETKEITDRLLACDGKRLVFVTGDAGVGKSGVLRQAVDVIRKGEWPVLAFRVDNLGAAESPSQLGQNLGLPGDPARTLVAIAQGKDCLLVIDQLDAISLASGRRPELWWCLEEVISQALANANVRVLVACRGFDLRNDHRLRGLADTPESDRVEIGLLPRNAVQEVLHSLGTEASKLTDRQIDLLAVPLHLSLLAEIARGGKSVPLGIQTLADLYHEYWERKQMLIRERIGRDVAWTNMIDVAVDDMSERQDLSFPETRLDRFGSDKHVMISEHVFLLDAHRCSFFHESFFDYSFARRLASRGGDLLSLLTSGEQHLFRRAQVRQILAYERALCPDRYIAHVRDLLTSKQIRLHLKSVVLDLLATLPDPSPEELCVLLTVLEDPSNRCHGLAWRVLQCSLPWFHLLDSVQVWQRWLAQGDDERLNRIAYILWTVRDGAANRAAELVEPYLGTSESWNNRVAYLLDLGTPQLNYRYFSLFTKLIDLGMLDSGARDFWFLLHDLPSSHPDWAAEAIGQYLMRCLAIGNGAGQTDPFDDILYRPGPGQSESEALRECANGAPLEFVTHVLPFVIRVVEINADRSGPPPWHDSVWRFVHLRGRGLDEEVLTTVRDALCALAVARSEAFDAVAGSLRDSQYATLDLLLLSAYAANPAVYADESLLYVCGNPHRFEIDYVDYERGPAKELLRAATPHCDEWCFALLEQVILAYYPEYETRSGNEDHLGLAQLELLESCMQSRLSPAATRRLSELRRRYPDMDHGPRKSVSGFVGSPIPHAEAQGFTDDQWLSAIAQYNGVDQMIEVDGSLIGGGEQLAQVLGEHTKGDPARFTRLAFQFPDDTDHVFFDAILTGISGAPGDPDAVLSLCRRCHSMPGRPYGRWVHKPIGSLSEYDLPTDILDMVSWYATNDSDPVPGVPRIRFTGGDPETRQELVTEGMNSVRGSAALTLAQLIWDHPRRLSHLLPTLKSLVSDESASVRACAAHTLIAVLQQDRDLAVELFQGLCDTDESLLGTMYVERFLSYAVRTHLHSLLPVLNRMLESTHPLVERVAGRQLSLVAITVDDAHPYLDRLLAGSEQQRIGVAEVCVANLRNARLGDACERVLVGLFSDRSELVADEAAGCFDEMGDGELGAYSELARRFMESPVFAKQYRRLIRALLRSGADVSELSADACGRALSALTAEIAGQGATAIHMSMLPELVVRAYGQSTDLGVKRRCLDHIDQLIEMGLGDMGTLLQLHDR